MRLKTKLVTLSIIVHAFLFTVAALFHEELGYWLLAVECVLVLSLVIFIHLIKKGLQPLEYLDTFSSLLKEQEFTARFSTLNQSELDQLIEQFNRMLQQLHAERLAIGEQRGVFEKLMAESPIGVLLFDFEQRLSDINPAAEHLLEIQKHELLGKNLNQIDAPAMKYLKDIEVNSHQLVTTQKGGKIKIGHYDIYDRGFSRSFYMIYEMTSDIVQSQKAAYEKLIRLMSHEVNNTIASTNSLLESSLNFKDQLDADSQVDFEHAINIVINRCASLNEFMRGYAEIVKLAKPYKANLDITQLLQNLITLMHADCQQRQCEIVQYADEPHIIKADAKLLEQALINIFKNALEAIGSNGQVEVRLSSTESSLVLSISDTGSGISEEAASQIFTPFYTSKESGQGLGLMLVREILDLHGFSFELSNNKSGPGATFSIQIPRV